MVAYARGFFHWAVVLTDTAPALHAPMKVRRYEVLLSAGTASA